MRIVTICGLFCAFLLPAEAGATGYGACLTLAAGTADGGTRVNHAGGGFALDTGIGRDRVVRYRLHAVLEGIHVKEEGPDKDGLSGFALDNMIGFGLIRKDEVDLWLGPDFRFGWFSGKYDSGPALGIGVAGGYDIALAPDLTLSFVAGYRDVLHVYLLDDLNERLWHLDVALLWGKRVP